MSRRGFVLLPLLLMLGVAVLLLAGVVGERAHRDHQLRWRAARIQGRELALGAAVLAPGAEVRVGPWRVVREADGRRRAEGPMGVFTIVGTGAGDAERWEARR